MFKVFKFYPEISLWKFKKERAWQDPDIFLYAEKNQTHCNSLVIMLNFFFNFLMVLNKLCWGSKFRLRRVV